MCWNCVRVCKRVRSAIDLSSVYSSVEYIINKLNQTAMRETTHWMHFGTNQTNDVLRRSLPLNSFVLKGLISAKGRTKDKINEEYAKKASQVQ